MPFKNFFIRDQEGRFDADNIAIRLPAETSALRRSGFESESRFRRCIGPQRNCHGDGLKLFGRRRKNDTSHECVRSALDFDDVTGVFQYERHGIGFVRPGEEGRKDLAARPSRDIIVLAHQELTRSWWETRRARFNMVISPIVIDECGAGDATAAQERLALIKDLAPLTMTADVEKLAARYIQELKIPFRAVRDAFHLAFSCLYRVDYLLTWNCKHIANAEIYLARS